MRRIVLLVSAVSLALGSFGVAQPASAKPLTALVAEPFEVTGNVGNDSPPTNIQNFRIYLDGDNFTISPVATFSPASLQHRIQRDNAMGIKVIPVVTQFTLNGAPSTFEGAVVEGCFTEVTGLLLKVNTNVNQDQALAMQVDTTCP